MAYTSHSFMDNAIALRLLVMLTTPFKEMDAYKAGVIDDKGKYIVKPNDRTAEQKKVLTYLDKLIINVKKMINKLPGGENNLKNIIAAMILIKENMEYENKVVLTEENLAKVACECLNLPCPEPDLSDWTQMVDDLRHADKEVRIALVGKYTALHDAYISVVEALKHGCIPEHATVDIKWIDSELVTDSNAAEILGDVHGIIVPGGFGDRGVEGMISAARYARENNIPYLGLCLGMQVSIIEFARHVVGLEDAHSIELNPRTSHPVIALLPDQNGVTDLGGTLRLGSYPCLLDKTSKAYELYGTDQIAERHRHRYEVNNDYRQQLIDCGMKLCGTSPDGRIVEMIELPEHPWFVATQAHPELKSRPNRPHPLFHGFISAACKKIK